MEINEIVRLGPIENNKPIHELIEEAAELYSVDFPGQRLDPLFTQAFYFGMDDEEQEQMNYQDFRQATSQRIDEILSQKDERF